MNSKTVTYIAAGAVFILGVVMGLWLRGLRPSPAVDPVIVTDTTWIHDTTFVEKPVPHYVRVVDTMLVPVVDTLHIRDSVFISLPREEKIYQDSTYRAVVSGYMPSLDSISIFQATKYITTTITIPQKTRRWGIGVHAGVGVQYGTIGKRMDVGPYIGVGVSYNILTF